ncbi:MAG: Bug family tripartite tricarboxylate transporter substrate binding protein [Acetobacteraceae bacterium]
MIKLCETVRRLTVGLLAAALTLVGTASAETWPTRPVKLILPYAPGGATDMIGRPWAEKLQAAFGQPFVIDNRGGASGAIGTEAAARSAPDGYTFLLTPGATLTILPQLRKVGYDPRKDLVPVARMGDLVCGFVIVPSLGINSIKELVAYAKAHPGQLAYGSAGLGTYSQMRIEMLKLRAGVDILHVPYRGSADALNDLLAGSVQLMNEINVLPHVRAGRLKLLNINYPTRHPDFPDVPTLAEAGYPDADVPIQYTLNAPAGTPKEIITVLNRKIVEISKTPDMIARMRAINVIVPQETPEEMVTTQEQQWQSNGALIREAKIRLD